MGLNNTFFKCWLDRIINIFFIGHKINNKTKKNPRLHTILIKNANNFKFTR